MCVVHCFCSSSCRSRPVDRAECVWLCSNGDWEGLFNQADGGCAGVLPNHSHSHTRSYPRLLSSLSPHSVPSELAFIIPAGNHLEMWLVFGEDCSLMKNIIFKAPFPAESDFCFVFFRLGPSLTITKALQTSDVCSDSSLTQSTQNYAIEVSFSYCEWHICLSTTVRLTLIGFAGTYVQLFTL